MSSAEEIQWSIFDASQFLPAVLSDPNKGKQSNFFTATWGDSFVEKTFVENSSHVPEILYDQFEYYLQKYGKRLERHVRINNSVLDETKVKLNGSCFDSKDNLTAIPKIYLKSDFNLNKPEVFSEILTVNSNAEHQIQEKLSHYLDIVEEQIAEQVSQKSAAFFNAMTSHDTVMEQMALATTEVRVLRSKVKQIDKSLALDALKLLAIARSKHNHLIVIDKLRLMSTVLQTQPMLQLLLSSSDYVAALELISGTQEILFKELAGVTSLRHLPSQLKEMARLIDKMLTTEFERFAAADLHRPLDSGDGVIEQDRLVSLVAGLLKQNHFSFLDIYRHEALTAVQALLKQLLVEELADAEDELRELTGSGEMAPLMDSVHWLKILKLANKALVTLIHRVKAVHDVIKETALICAGLDRVSDSALPGTEYSVTRQTHGIVAQKLHDLLVSVCDYCNERLAALVSKQNHEENITSDEVADLAIIERDFTNFCESICNKQSGALRAALKVQAGNYIIKFNNQRQNKLMLVLDAERWKSADVPTEIQQLVDIISSGDILKSLPKLLSPKKATEKVSPKLIVKAQEYVVIGTALILIRLVYEYCICAFDLQLMSPIIGKNLSDLLKSFNSNSCRLILGAQALRTAGLKTITSTNLALASRSLELVLWMIPHIRKHFQTLIRENVNYFDSVEKDIGSHVQQLESKILSIMKTLLGDQLNEWEAKPPVPSVQFRNISRHLIKLHEAVNAVLREEQVNDIYQEIHKSFKIQLNTQILKMNIENNGGPQHGIVTSEIMFYLQTINALNVMPQKCVNNNDMSDIWNK